MIFLSCQTSVVTYNPVVKSAETTENSFCSQSGFPAATFGNCSWQCFLARAPAAAPICKGSALKWPALAGSPTVRVLGQQQGSLSRRALTSLILPLVPGPCSLCTISVGHTQQDPHRVLGAVTEWNCSFLRDEFKSMKIKTLSYRTQCYLLCNFPWSTQCFLRFGNPFGVVTTWRNYTNPQWLAEHKLSYPILQHTSPLLLVKELWRPLGDASPSSF